MLKKLLVLCVFGFLTNVYGQSINQTSTVSTISTSADQLPFQISIDLAGFQLPNGLHSYVSAVHDNKILLLAGRTNGLHGFTNTDDNFPPQMQNTVVYVVDFKHETTYAKSLSDPTSGLTQTQIDSLSVTSPQYYQKEDTLYISGGYGVDTGSGTFSTKGCFTAIDVPGLMRWVVKPHHHDTAAKNIRQILDPFFQVTGGYMDRGSHDQTLLIFGQNFVGFYSDSSNGAYTDQVRTFKIHDHENHLSVTQQKGLTPSTNYRRRDLNVVPVVTNFESGPNPAYIALSGVFTEAGGIWTVPVMIYPDGSSSMADPNNPATFKQGMNNYASAYAGLYSHKTSTMHNIIFGGISYGYFVNGVFTTDNEIPFINQVTTIALDKNGNFTQYLMANQYPTIPSTGSNPGNPLLFGAGAKFFRALHLDHYDNGVLKLDHLGKDPLVIGYIVGGIASTLGNTNVITDSTASAYIFKVTLVPTN